MYLPDLAMTLSNLGKVDRMENRIQDARGHYREALAVLQKLAQQDGRYAGGAASVEATLRELDAASAPQ